MKKKATHRRGAEGAEKTGTQWRKRPTPHHQGTKGTKGHQENWNECKENHKSILSGDFTTHEVLVLCRVRMLAENKTLATEQCRLRR